MNFINRQYIKWHCSKSGNGLAYFAGYILVLVLMVCWTDRNLDWVLSEYKGYEVNCPWYLSALLTIIAPLTLLFNVICEILRLVV